VICFIFSIVHPLRKFIGLFVFSLGFVHIRSYFYPLYSYTLRLLYTLKNKEVVMKFPSYAILCGEGFEPYIEYYDDPEDMDFYMHCCRIKPSTPPEIRKKIEKELKELEKEQMYQVPSYAVLRSEGFEPYIECDIDWVDARDFSNMLKDKSCLIKPSAPPEICKKIEKRLKELEKGRKTAWGGDFPTKDY
jgi:hypothetical protein